MSSAATNAKLIADPGALGVLAAGIANGRIDVCDLLAHYLRRIDAVEAEVQGWRIVDRDSAMAQAENLRAEARAGKIRGPLHGIPVAVKDVIDVAGLPTRAGSATRERVPAAGLDAQAVTRLRAAGSIILGKAHTTEFAYFDGPPPTRNPWNLAHTPGGSSSGPAAVVAAGMVPLSIGTQTAGSVSRPAAYCGIAAFKPSTGAWPSFGVVPFAPRFDTVGLFGYRVADAAMAAQSLMPPFLERPLRGAARPAIAVIDDPLLKIASAAAVQAVESAAEKLRAAGATVLRRASPVELAKVIAWHKTVTEYELARAHADLACAPDGLVTPALLAAIGRGCKIDTVDYALALRAIDAATATFWKGVGDCDAVFFPAAPDVAPAGMKTGDPRFIIPFTALGGPIVSVPTTIAAEGLPLGVMLMGPPGSDAAIGALAERLAPAIELPR